MSGPTPLHFCDNLFTNLADKALALCALGEALKAVDIERIEDPDTFLSGLGHLIDAVGVGVLETAHQGRDIAKEPGA